MPHPLQGAYDMYVEKLNKVIAEENKIKKMLNEFASEMKIQQPFPNITQDTVITAAVNHDDFVGKSASTAVGEYLEKIGKAVRWEEIEEALTKGGYDWNKHGDQKKTRTTITKNTFTFKYIKSSNAFGLKKWYPDESNDNKQKDNKKESVAQKENVITEATS